MTIEKHMNLQYLFGLISLVGLSGSEHVSGWYKIIPLVICSVGIIGTATNTVFAQHKFGGGK